MSGAKKKLFISGVSLLIAVVLIAGSAFAWFTLSTKPEAKDVSFKISSGRALLLSKDGETYAYTIDFSDMFMNLADLHPISTTDGVNWFIPTYDESGFPNKDAKDFLRVKVGDGYDNVSIIDPATGEPYTGQQLLEVEDKGYFVWAEFYIKTEETECDVRLSIPKTIDEDELDGYYGTYVLPRYRINKDDELAEESESAETSVRIGFLIDDRFVIYEPNAEKRSSAGKPNDDEGKYVLDYTADPAEYQEGYYIPTEPIGMIGDEEPWEAELYTPFTETTPGDAELYTEKLYVEATAPYDFSGDTAYYEYGYMPYDPLTPGGRPTLYLKNGETYEEAEYDEEETETYYYYVLDYRLYRGNGYGGDDLILYQKNYIEQKYYLEETNLHYFVKTYVEIGEEYDEALLLYIKETQESESSVFHRADGTEEEGTTYYELTYVPYDTSLGKTAEGLCAIGMVRIDNDTYDPESGTEYFTRTVEEIDMRDCGPQMIADSDMIVQKSGSYNEDAVESMLRAAEAAEKDPAYDSTMVDEFGYFIRQYGEITEIPPETDPEGNEKYYSDTVIVHLTKNTPVIIRMFIWIEGQDKDCWNDISSGAFNVNIEFAGTTY